MGDHEKPKHEPWMEKLKRDAALQRHDAHPGIAIGVLAVMAFLILAIAFQLVSVLAGSA
jgi:hypothetical protein